MSDRLTVKIAPAEILFENQANLFGARPMFERFFALNGALNLFVPLAYTSRLSP